MDFKDADYLINHLDECVRFLKIFKSSAERGIILQQQSPDLFNRLSDITNSSVSEEEKQEQKYLAFAKHYNKSGNIGLGKHLFKGTFDEQLYIDFIEHNEGLSGISEEISKIEAEFWRNCPNPNNINILCNVYRERWTGHLYKVDTEQYRIENLLTSNNDHPLYTNLKILRACGLITVKETKLEFKLEYIAHRINLIVSGVSKFFKEIRRATINTKDLPELSNQNTNSTVSNTSKSIESSNRQNAFNGQPLKEVEKHFSTLCQITNKTNNKPILTPLQLDDFIHQAFVKNAPSNQKITMNKGNHDGANIQRVFWNYWNNIKIANEYSTPNNNVRTDYAKLLTDYFKGFELKKVMNNFKK